jgi:hypothetical protein
MAALPHKHTLTALAANHNMGTWEKKTVQTKGKAAVPFQIDAWGLLCNVKLNNAVPAEHLCM